MSQKQLTVSQLQPNYRLETPLHLQYVLVSGLVSGIVGLTMALLLPEAPRLIATFLVIIGVLALSLVGMLLLVTKESIRYAARRRMMNDE